MEKYQALRDEVQRRGMSINKLAIEAGITPPSLYAALAGNVRFWPGWRKRIAEALQMDEDVLFPEEEREVKDEH